MRLRLLGGQWYSNFRPKEEWGVGREKIQVALGVYGGKPDKPPMKAQQELGKIMGEAENGIHPGGVRRKLSKIKLKGPVKERYQQILDKWIYSFFGNYRPKDITQKVIEEYLEYRWGLDSDGGFQAVENTWSKELYVLNKLIRVVLPNFSAPKAKYRKLEKEILPPLSMQQITEASKFVIKKYRPIFWVMAYTAMDISDALDLKPAHITDGMIVKPRGKTSEEIAVPICPALSEIMKSIPRPLSKSTPYFQDYTSNAISVDIRKAFRKSGLPGYGAKYLRRYVASALLDAGFSMDWVGKALAHADKSPLTQKYTGIYKSTLMEAFKKLG